MRGARGGGGGGGGCWRGRAERRGARAVERPPRPGVGAPPPLKPAPDAAPRCPRPWSCRAAPAGCGVWARAGPGGAARPVTVSPSGDGRRDAYVVQNTCIPQHHKTALHTVSHWHNMAVAQHIASAHATRHGRRHTSQETKREAKIASRSTSHRHESSSRVSRLESMVTNQTVRSVRSRVDRTTALVVTL